MVHYDKFTLDNGLRVIFHKEELSPMVAVNTLYDVGARDEDENKTGFAHLFEHLMFGGSINIPEFDTPLQQAGGENNAFTSNDITNYYDVLPAQNLETALWLESDRMLSLAFTPKSLEVQRSVVIEEFKQRYLNQPYGDVWLQLRPLAYEIHPYKWATIGKEISHIEDATMDDVKGFFKKHYNPSNAILCIAGNFELDEVKKLVTKWYGDIPAGEKYNRSLESEPVQTSYREKTIERDVPTDAFYYAFHMPARTDKDFYASDLVSDILGRDKSSRLYVKLKKEKQLASSINAFITGSLDSGLLVISGKLNDGVSFDELDSALWPELKDLISNGIKKEELQKVLNKVRTSKEFEEQGMLNRAMALCYFELLGDAEMINGENEKYASITADMVKHAADKMLQKENCSLLKIKAKS